LRSTPAGCIGDPIPTPLGGGMPTRTVKVQLSLNTAISITVKKKLKPDMFFMGKPSQNYGK